MVKIQAGYRIAIGSCILLFCLIIAGCGAVATNTKFYEPITQQVRDGQYAQAAAEFDRAGRQGKLGGKDRFLYYLDSGLLNHYAANYDTSNIRLSQAESAAEELFTRSISRAATSLLLNDNVLEYAGEDYEILYTNLLMALNYSLLGLYDDSFVEIRRANLKLGLLEQKYRDAAELLQRGQARDTAAAGIEYTPVNVRFANSAFARYLSMHMYAALGKYDDARLDSALLDNAFRTQPEIYNFDMPHFSYQSEKGAVLSIVGLAGLSPVKEALNLRIRTDKDLGLVQVLYTDSENKDSEYGHLPIPVKADYYFKFAIPKLADRPSEIGRIRVYVDSACVGDLQLIEDVAKVAEETFQAKKSLIYFRSVARAVAKGLTTHELKKKVDTGGVGGWMKKAAIDIGSDITENADLRCARFLPGKIYVGDFDLAPGRYNLKVEFLGYDGGVISYQEVENFDVKTDGLNLLRVFSLQ